MPTEHDSVERRTRKVNQIEKTATFFESYGQIHVEMYFHLTKRSFFKINFCAISRIFSTTRGLVRK